MKIEEAIDDSPPSALVSTGTNTGNGTLHSFTFKHMPSAKFHTVHEDKDAKALLIKWDLSRLSLAKFSYDEYFRPYQADEFLKSLFNSPQVQSAWQRLDVKGNPIAFRGPVSAVHKTELKATITNTAFFDRLTQQGIVRKTGHIAKCMDVHLDDGIVVSDRLRKLFMCPEDDFEDDTPLFSEGEQNEFIFHLLKLIATGGALNQYEDEFEPYLSITKTLYKEIVSVHKSQYSGNIEVSSSIFQILDLEGSCSPLFSRESPFNCCYVVVDPLKRQTTLIHSEFGSIF